jgi:ribosome biogenesis GTPase A
MQRIGSRLANAKRSDGDSDGEASYCAQDLVEALCSQRKFYQQGSGIMDSHRAATLVVKDFVQGRLQSWKLPPDPAEDEGHGLSELAALGLL